MLRNVAGHGETLDVGYNSPVSALASRTFNAKLLFPRILGADATFSLEGLVDTVRRTDVRNIREHRNRNRRDK